MVVADALSRSGITRLLDRMDRDGLITRTVSTTDRRRFDVSLTPPGRRRFEQVWPAHADGISRYFVQPLTPRDLGDLGRILHVLIQANQDHGQPADPGPVPVTAPS
jgi:DNA-binding MarR family transcriptional regulator